MTSKLKCWYGSSTNMSYITINMAVLLTCHTLLSYKWAGWLSMLLYFENIHENCKEIWQIEYM